VRSLQYAKQFFEHTGFPAMGTTLPHIPAKRYFTIGEVAELCGVKPHVLRYWEQEFTQLRPMKRRGNRRYYQHHEVLMIRRIRDLLYDQGFTISGARNRLQELTHGEREGLPSQQSGVEMAAGDEAMPLGLPEATDHSVLDFAAVRQELWEIRALLI
jgi:DNA-binding transcriptional MerR regulator